MPLLCFLPLLAVTASFLEHPVSTVISVGETATLDCSVAGFPIPDIVWTRDGMEVPESGEIETDTMLIGPQTALSSLIITSASVNLTGAYRCRSITTVEGFPPEVVESNPASITVQGTYVVHAPSKFL